MIEHLLPILFVFALGACVGSFLNVVVYRLPPVEGMLAALRALSHPPSHCPKCKKPLAWYDNVPIFGWIMLKGKCRYCGLPISPRYPIIEAITGCLFAGYYIAFFILGYGPCGPMPAPLYGVVQTAPMMVLSQDWPMYALYMVLIAALLAASLIDAEQFIIPIEIPWFLAIVGVVAHGFIDRPGAPGALNASMVSAPLAIGGTIGFALALCALKFGWFPRSFPHGEPDLVAQTPEGETPANAASPGRIRAEILKELLFLGPAMLLGIGLLLATKYSPAVHDLIKALTEHRAASGALGSLFGAITGALIIWLTRIFGTLLFGRVAMGLGDMHLMIGIGAVIGSTVTIAAFFIAPFFGIGLALYMLITRKRHELPYGPYLSLGTAMAILFYCGIDQYLTEGAAGLMYVLGW